MGPALQVPPGSAPLSSEVRSMLAPLQMLALLSAPALGVGTGVPRQMQFTSQVSLVVQPLPSSHGVPGNAGPPGMPRQSAGRRVPAQLQEASYTSLIVPALPSSQAVPGRAVPFGIPRQSRQVLFGTMPVRPPEQTPQA